MKGLVFSTLAVGLLLSVFAISASGAPGAPALTAVPSPGPGPGDKEKLAALSKKLLALEKEVRALESLVQKKRADGRRLGARSFARKLEHLKKELARTASRIEAMKARIEVKPARRTGPTAGRRAARRAAARSKAVTRTTRQKRKTTQAYPTRRTLRQRKAVVFPSPTYTYRWRQPVQKQVVVRSTTGRKCSCGKCPCQAKKPGPRSAAPRGPSPVETGKIKAHLSRLLKAKAALEKKLKQTHVELAKGKRALASLMRKKTVDARRLQYGVRLRAAAKKRAELRIRATRQARVPATRRRPPPRPGPDHGAAVLQEMRKLRHDVGKITRLLEAMLGEIRKAHAPAPKRRKARAVDMKTL